MPERFLNLDEATRRSFLSDAARSLLGVGLLPCLSSLSEAGQPSLDNASGGTARSVIYLYMSGGMSHLDTFDPKPGAETQGPVEALSTNVPGVRVSEYFPRTARQMDKVAVVNSLSSTQGAHAQGRYFMHTSYFLRGTIRHPDLGAYSSRLLPKLNDLLPANVKIGGNSSGLGGGFLEARHAALPIGDPAAGLQYGQLPSNITDERFQRRLQRLKRMNADFARDYRGKAVRSSAAMYDEAVKLMKSEDLTAFDIAQEATAVRDSYGDNKLGQGCLLARRLVEKGVRFVEVDDGGWDTHTDNFERVAEKSAVLDQALAALLDDWSERGMLDTTLVVLATEFGRTPDIVPGRDGRNHYPKAFTCLLAGGGIRGGQVHGKTDEEGREVIEDQVTAPDFNATVAYALGLPLDREIISPSQRPFKIAADGQPVRSLFG